MAEEKKTTAHKVDVNKWKRKKLAGLSKKRGAGFEQNAARVAANK